MSSGILKNPKHESFAQLVALHDERPAMAYIAVGYKGRGNTAEVEATRLMQREDVAERIHDLRVSKLAVQTRAVASLGINKQWVMDGLVRLAMRCMQEEPVVDAKGVPTWEFKFDSAGAAKAYALLGKELGMFIERKDVTVRHVDELDEAEIEREIAELDDAERSGAGNGAAIH